MAASTSFKQQCPSCEAMVPIRDPNLIGRKIDCPKCKYRFVVEDPGTAEDEDEPKAKGKRDANDKNGAKSKAGARRRDEDDEDDGKAGKSGGNNKLILGVGLAVVAVGLLIAVGWLMFGGGGSSSSTPSKSGGSGLAQNNQPAETPKEEEKKETAVASAGANVPIEALTNLAPPDSEGICLVHMQDLRKNVLGRVMFNSPGTFNASGLQTRLGFSVDEVDVVLQAWNFTQNWTLSVIHTKSPFNLDNLKAVLGAKPVDEKDRPEGQEYFILDSNPWLDMLGHSSFAALLQTNPALLARRSGPRALRVHDDQTIIIADLKPMQLFLSKKGMFDKRSPDAGATTAAAEKEKPQSAEEGGPGNMRGMMGRGGMGQGGMGQGGMGQGGQQKVEEAPAAGPSGAYLTINPALKTMLDRVEAKQPVISLAFDKVAADKGRVPVLGVNLLVNAQLRTMFEDANVIGAAAEFKDGITLTFAAGYGSDDEHDRRLKSMQTQDGPELAKLLTKAMETEVEYTDEDPNALAMNGAEGGMGMGMMGRGMGQGGGFTGGIGGNLTQSRPSMGGGANSGPPAGMNMAPGNGTGGRRGGLGTGGDIGEGQFGMGVGGAPGGGMRMGGMGMGQQQDQRKSDKPVSTVRVTSPDKALVLITVHFIDKAANDKFMNRRVRQIVLQQKGNLDMAGGPLMLHKLGDAIFSYPKGKDHLDIFPRGARHREIASLREGRPYPPNDRLSWMVELLPYLGPEQQDLYNQIDREKSWRHEDNLPLASTLVPYFLDPQTPVRSWYVRVPGTDEVAATTQFVGIAGVGLDAAAYPDSDPSVAKKLGIFGYDRQTRLADVTDKTSHTVFLIQVPPTYKRPWMAGGGSTVMGVPESGSIRPFVSTTRDGKKGTHALMADGSVRWISENISDEAFKALCTAKGGETVLLNREAPEVPRPEGQAELKVVTAPPPQAPRPKPPSTKSSGPGEVKIPEGWKEFVSKADGFSVALPGTPEKRTIQMNSLIQMTVNMYETHGPDGRCTVDVSNIPVISGDEDFVQFFKSEAESVQGTGKMVRSKDLRLGKYFGREWVAQELGGRMVYARAYVVNRVGFKLEAMGMSEDKAQMFLDSFRLLSMKNDQSSSAAPSEPKKQETTSEQVVAILKKHCAMCHMGPNAKPAADPMRLFTLTGVFDESVAAAKAEKVAEVLESGKMPPKNRPRLTNAETTALQKWAQAKH